MSGNPICAVFCLTFLLFPSGYGQALSLVDIVGGSGPFSFDNQQSPGQQPRSQPSSPLPQPQQQHSRQQDTRTTFHLDSLLSATGQRSVSAGTSGEPSSLLRHLQGMGGSAGGQLSRTKARQAYCTPRERGMVFSSCAMTFGMAHMAFFETLSMFPTCQSKVFSCRAVDSLMRCTNSLPETVISNKCWPALRDLFTSYFKTYGVPCSYSDLRANCQTRAEDLLTLEQRQKINKNSNPTASRKHENRGFLMRLILSDVVRGGAGFGLFGGM